MISISTLYCGRALASHGLRYGAARPAGPVVVFNCTSRCNLACAHCYASGITADGPGDLSTAEALALLDDLAAAGVPVVLFSGGEPTLRPDLPDLLERARQRGMRATVSTNGTAITAAMAETFARAGVAYVGVSIDGLGGRHDEFRGQAGAFEAAMRGIAHCRAAGVKVGLRMTLTTRNAADLDGVLELLRAEGVPRVCFYHLVYSGRGGALRDEDLAAAQRRAVLDRLMDFAAAENAAGRATEVLTVDNHADGPYLYLRLLRERSPLAATALDLLRRNGGNASGVRLACVRPDGTVLPDQFWASAVLGNVRDRPFRAIWADGGQALLAQLRRRRRPLTGRCVRCRWLDVCNGNFRARAEAATGQTWGDDPSCYLTEAEIAPGEGSA